MDWLVKNIPNNNGNAGIWGISYPGFYATAAIIDAHPALVAASPQSPVTDYYMGDDPYQNGAFFLAANFEMGKTGPALPDTSIPRFDYENPAGYDFFLSAGPLTN